MDYNFEGRKILVTGSGRGVGRALASSLARAGAKVYALDCVKETLDDLVKEIPSITAIHQDLKNWEQTREKVSQLADLEGLVNCAGVLEMVPALDTTKELTDSMLDVHLKAPINLMQIVGKQMILNGRGGSIVNMSGVSGTTAIHNLMAYCASKAALIMATKVFALELGPQKVRVNAVAPSAVNTKFHEGLPDELLSAYVAQIPMGRMIEVDEVVQPVMFLLSDQSKMITGTTILVDGGHTCFLPV